MARNSKRFDYFKAFEQQAELALKEAELLIETIENFSTSEGIKDVMPRAHEIEHAGDEISHTVFSAIAVDFITPIEREDIITLSQYLDDILDYIEDVVQRFYMYDITEMHPYTLDFAKIIKRSCEALVATMEDFKNFKKSQKFRKHVAEINSYEEDADIIYVDIIRSLHADKKDDPLYILTWSQLFMRMEKCTDACEDAADTMHMIVLKNS